MSPLRKFSILLFLTIHQNLANDAIIRRYLFADISCPHIHVPHERQLEVGGHQEEKLCVLTSPFKYTRKK